LAYSQYRMQDKLVLAVVFGLFSAIGNYIGIPVLGALANTRIVGPIAGGLLGGSIVGVGAGIIGAFPRWLLGGYTVAASVIANIVAGIISGYVYRKFGPSGISLKVAFLTALVCELVLKTLVLILSKPFEQAWELEKIIAIPTIIANCLAVTLFVYIVQDVFKEQQKVQAQSAQQSIRMITQTTEFLREGLNENTAKKIAEIIMAETKAAAVSITDARRILAFIGAGADHHLVNEPILTTVTQQAMESRHTVIVNDKAGIGCPYPDCPLTAIIDAPLIVDGQLCGTLKLCKSAGERISPYEAEIIQGIADVLSLLLARRQMEDQKIMLAEAEHNMLKAQVNPHFLFNTLSTIRALVRTSPDTARGRIKDLSNFLRRTLDRRTDMATLSEELDIVREYVRLEKSRFGERIQVVEHVPSELQDCLMPVFTLQPLVENAIKHGLSPKRFGGGVAIRAFRVDDALCLEVSDDGIGIPTTHLAAILRFDDLAIRGPQGSGIGLNNVHKRLQATFGSCFGLRIQSREGSGTTVQAHLPVLRREEADG
jgi:two-component system, LytTR family, sensor histidine kinase LytS